MSNEWFKEGAVGQRRAKKRMPNQMNLDTMARYAPFRGDRSGPVVFGYDGSELARAAIAAAGWQLPAGRVALVVTVWRTFDVGFIPEPGIHFDAASAHEVKDAAEQTAADGAALAKAAGFRAQGIAVEGTPTWKAITDTADDQDASLIIVGSHARTGFVGRLVGSVAAAVAAHSRRTVLIEHDHAGLGLLVPSRRHGYRCPHAPLPRRRPRIGGIG